VPLNHLNSARHRAPLATQVARPPRRVSLQRIWRSLALPLTALPLLGAGLAAEPASAGEYSVELCHTTAGHNAPIDPRFSNAEDYYGWGTSCGQSGGTTNLQMGELGRGTGAFVRAELPMPSGVRLVGGSIRRRVLMADPGAGLRDFSASPVWTAYTRSEGGDRVIETCAWFECRTIGWPDSSWRDFAVPSASALLWDLSCGGNAGGGPSLRSRRCG